MIGKLTIPMLVLLLGACDRNQGTEMEQTPAEGEGYEQVEPGMGQPADDAQAMRSTLDRRLTAAEEWVTTRRQELAASGAEVSPEMTLQLDELERRLQEIQRTLEQPGDQGLTEADSQLTEIEREIQQFDTQQPTEPPMEEEHQQPFEEMEG